MLVEKEIEAKLIEKLATALASVSGVKILGSWQSTNDGEVKGLEDAANKVIIATSAGSPAFDTYTTPIASIPLALAVTIRQELAPTAAELETVISPIEELLVGWQMDLDGSSASGLSSTHFRVDGVRLDAGDPPQFSTAKAVWTITRALTVRGTIINN